jgi:NAD(P)-dependent dehydrogenase (short-subunit alcohol dehydrogenase family)
VAKTAVVSGAGSGIGRAVALALAKEGWQVAVTGRREEALRETARLARAPLLVLPGDIRDAGAVERTAAAVLGEFGDLRALVNAAGANVPARSLEGV